MDTTSALAMIPEQEMEQTRSSGQDFTRVSSKGVAHVDKQKQQEASKLGKMLKPETDDNVATLKAFRCRNGLCFKYGENWSPGHTCPPHISLHVLEGLLDTMDMNTLVDDDDEVEVLGEEQEVLALQVDNSQLNRCRHTMKLSAQIGKHKVLMLVDSGSIGIFVSEHLVNKLRLPTESCKQ
jgi:hypothetical protein